MTRMYRVTARRGRRECQEVRAPRTCPAVRMRRAPAPQGKSSAFLPRPSSPAPPEGGVARPETGGPAPEGGQEGGAATASAPPPSLKEQHLRSEMVSGWVRVLQPSHLTDGKLGFRGGGKLLQVGELGNTRNWNSELADQDCAEPREAAASHHPLSLEWLGWWARLSPQLQVLNLTPAPRQGSAGRLPRA